MSPEYFMHTLTIYEAQAYMEGVLRRQRPLWEIARYIGFHAAAPHCKGFSWEKMGKFPWEGEIRVPVDVEKEAEELAELRERIRARDNYKNNIDNYGEE